MFPFEARVIVPVLAAFDGFGLYGTLTHSWETGMDHAGHLGGLVFGILYAYYLKNSKKF